MIRNEYRRGLIMLRPIAQGYSGHVRLERRTLMGSMYFIVNVPDRAGELRAALAGRKNGEYYAAEAGILRRDGRGQATLAYTFDPRNIDGRPLEDYIFVVIVRTDGCRCEPVLSGNVDGAREADFEKVEEAVCTLFIRECGPAWDIPERPFPIVPQPPARPVAPRPEPGMPSGRPPQSLEPGRPEPPASGRPEQRPPDRPESPGPDRPEQRPPDWPGNSETNRPGNNIPSRPGENAGAGQRPEGNPGGVMLPESGPENNRPEIQPENRPQYDRPGGEAPGNGGQMGNPNGSLTGGAVQGEGAQEDLLPDPGGDAPAFARSHTDVSPAANSLPGIDASVPWSSAIEGIRSYFATLPRESVAFDDDFVYVRAPMPEGSGFSHVLIGLEVDDGRIEAARFALPGRFSDIPPAGLDNYVWIGGPTEGWWVLTVNPQTGNPIEFDD